MKTIATCFLLTFSWLASSGQFNRYLITFRDKNNSPYSIAQPNAYLSQRAIDKRIRYDIVIDSSDLPVNPAYIDSVRLSGAVTILNISKWNNQVSIQTTDAAALTHISQLPYVSSALPIASRIGAVQNKFVSENTTIAITSSAREQGISSDYYRYGRSNAQVKMHQGDFLHNHGFRGQGMQLAVIDAGFFNYNLLPTFDSARISNRILGTWDFVANESSVAEDDSHGMHCFSAIGANLPGQFVGTAPETSFYLFRSEDVAREYPIEEHNLSVAAERADSLGVDVCSISLGYSTFDDPAFDYTYNDMNGRTTISARSMNIAARKGLLIVTAAGNEGNKPWRYIITPADADSVMAIGAVDSLGNIASFSSYGPSSDGQVKPSVCAVGRNAVVANNFSGLPNFGSGTSYACPIMAGISTCLWQSFPEASNMEIINTMQSAATQFTNPDDRKGYGIPDAKKAFVLLQKKYRQVQATFFQCKAMLTMQVKTDSSMKIAVERKFPDQSDYTSLTEWLTQDAYGMHTFNYADDLSGTNYPSVAYRFKMTIGTDTTYYIDSALVSYQNSCNHPVPVDFSLVVFPNPTTAWLNINVGSPERKELSLAIFNEQGQRVYTENIVADPGTTLRQIPTQQWSRGIYFIHIQSNGKTLMTKRITKG